MPVAFPGAFGYGASATRGAFSGPTAPVVYKVTNANDSGLGSFRYGLETLTGPRVIVYQRSGYIIPGAVYQITSPYVTIAGFTAPSPGIEFQKYGFFITTHDVVMSHIAIRPGESGQAQADNCAMIAYDTNAYNLFFDHVTATWGPDENFAADKYGSPDANITFFRCLTAESLDFPTSSPANASHGLLVQSPTKRVSVSQSIFANNRERNPYMQSATETAVTNNYIYNGYSSVAGFSFSFADINGDPGTLPMFASVVGNHLKFGPETGTDSTYLNQGAKFGLIGESDFGHVLGAKIYDHDNTVTTYPGVTVNTVENTWGYDPFVASAPAEVPLTGFTIWDSADVPTWAPRRAGTRPANRPDCDQRILDYIEAQTGPGYISTQADVGGYPTLAVNTNTFTPVANFTSTDPVTGYTYGELQLQDLQWAVQGITIMVTA